MLFRFDDMLSVRRPIDDMSLSYADVISKLAMVTDAVLAFTDSFSAADVPYVFLLSFGVLFDVFSCFLPSFIFFKCTSSMNKII